MNTVLLFFALPISTIILAIVLQKILKCPILVAATFFAIYVIVTYAFAGPNFLVFAIAYTILAYITAVLTRILCDLIQRLRKCNNLCNCDCNCCCNCNNQSNVATVQNQIQPTCATTVSNGTWCCTSRNNPSITLRAGINNSVPGHNITNGDNPMVILTNENGKARGGCNCGCGRR